MRMSGDDPKDETLEGFIGWSFRQEAILFARLEHLDKEEATLRTYEALRARLSWDADRRHDAAELGDTLSRRPASVRARLGRSRQGVLWLIERWRALGRVLDHESSWDDARSALVFDLLGIPKTLRTGDPWTAAGLHSPRALVDREIATLEATLSSALNALDDFERTEATAGRPVAPSAATLRLRREQSACWRRLQAIEREISKESDRQVELTKIEAQLHTPAAAPPASSRPQPLPPPNPFPGPRPAPFRPVTTASLAPAPASSLPTSSPPPGNRRARRAALRLEKRRSR